MTSGRFYVWPFLRPPVLTSGRFYILPFLRPLISLHTGTHTLAHTHPPAGEIALTAALWRADTTDLSWGQYTLATHTSHIQQKQSGAHCLYALSKKPFDRISADSYLLDTETQKGLHTMPHTFAAIGLNNTRAGYVELFESAFEDDCHDWVDDFVESEGFTDFYGFEVVSPDGDILASFEPPK